MSHASPEISEKAKSLLGMDSPLFDVLWPNIFDVADRETQDNLHLTHSYFRCMWERADIQHKSDWAKSEYIDLAAQRSYPKECRIDSPSSLWYSWGAYKSGFGSTRGFYEFCDIAGVDPQSGMMVDPEDEDEGWVFLSSDKDLTFTTLNHPLSEDYWGGYVHRFGCTGVREKSLQLENWWLENGDCSRMFRGTRYVDPIHNQAF